jgi:DNA polymerase III subunit epsilon
MAYTFVDFETTGLEQEIDQIIEIGAIKTDLTNEIARLNIMVKLNGGRVLSQEIIDLTGIQPEELENGMDEVPALDMLREFIRGDIVVAHHAPFDLGFFASRYGEQLWNDFACTRVMTMLAEPGESASLADVCARHGIALEGHHRSLNDIAATIEVFKVMEAKLAATGTPYLNTVIDSAERPLTYIPPKVTNIINQ